MTENGCLYCENDKMLLICDEDSADGLVKYEVRWCDSCGAVREERTEEHQYSVDWTKPDHKHKPRNEKHASQKSE